MAQAYVGSGAGAQHLDQVARPIARRVRSGWGVGQGSLGLD